MLTINSNHEGIHRADCVSLCGSVWSSRLQKIQMAVEKNHWHQRTTQPEVVAHLQHLYVRKAAVTMILARCRCLCWFVKHSCENECVLTSGSLSPFSTRVLSPHTQTHSASLLSHYCSSLCISRPIHRTSMLSPCLVFHSLEALATKMFQLKCKSRNVSY